MEWFVIIGLALNPGHFAAVAYPDQASCEADAAQYVAQGNTAECVSPTGQKVLDSTAATMVSSLDKRMEVMNTELTALCNLLDSCTIDADGRLVVQP